MAENPHQQKNTGRNQHASESFELLRTHSGGIKRLNNQRIIKPTVDPPTATIPDKGYSTEEIMRIASERFTQSYTRTIDVVSMLDNPFSFSLAGLTEEDAKKVELAELLITAAEKVSEQLYDRARLLLDRCDELSSRTGNSVERVVYYFSKALRERIDQKTGKTTYQGSRKQQLLEIDADIMALKPCLMAIYREVPFTQVAHCAVIQAIIENVTEAKKIHVIDLGIRTGVHWTGLMQALASDSGHPVEQLKITAIGTAAKHLIEETGKRLASFAESVALPFSFNIVMAEDMLELREDQFDLESDETVVIYTAYLLKRLIPSPERLDYMMKVIRVLNPSVMIVIEPELNSVSPSFVHRFVETLFYFSANFDCLEFCLGESASRVDTERLFFEEGIRTILAAEGEERNIRHAKLEVWRVFFARFGMTEVELSRSALLHGKMMAGKFVSGAACTLEQDGKSLLIGWKGTPLYSLSAWKFGV